MNVSYDRCEDKGIGPFFAFDDIMLQGMCSNESGVDHKSSISKDKEERVSNNFNDEDKVEEQKVIVDCKWDKKEMLSYEPDVEAREMYTANSKKEQNEVTSRLHAMLKRKGETKTMSDFPAG